MILSKKRRRLALTAPVALLAATLATNPGGIVTRMSSPDPAAIYPTALPSGRQITVLTAGDVLVHPPTWAQAAQDAAASGRPGSYDFTSMFASIRDTVAGADLALCHLETPVSEEPPTDFPAFRAPAEIITAIKDTGFDGCSTSSNHAFDYGESGVRKSLEILDREGLPHTGTYGSSAASRIPKIYTVNGVKIAHLSFSSFFNESRGKFRPKDKPWMANRLGDPGAVEAAARAAREAGADIVILTPHWGTEGDSRPNQLQQRLADKFTRNPDIDIVLGHHTHSVQPITKINGKWVAYSQGNLLARHDFPNDINRAGILTKTTFTRSPDGTWSATSIEAVPVWLALRPRIELINLPKTLTRLGALDDRRTIYDPAQQRITTTVQAAGNPPGLTVTTPTT